MISKDGGQSWSSPINISAFLAPLGPFYVGPGIGIQLTKGANVGRLLFIGHHGAYGYDGVWYSDDGGATYSLSNTSHFQKMDEVLSIMFVMFACIWWWRGGRMKLI